MIQINMSNSSSSTKIAALCAHLSNNGSKPLWICHLHSHWFLFPINQGTSCKEELKTGQTSRRLVCLNWSGFSKSEVSELVTLIFPFTYTLQKDFGPILVACTYDNHMCCADRQEGTLPTKWFDLPICSMKKSIVKKE